MSRPTKFESKIQEAVFTFIVVPLVLIVGVLVVSDIVSQRFGGEIVKWLLAIPSILLALAAYFKIKLKEIHW